MEKYIVKAPIAPLFLEPKPHSETADEVMHGMVVGDMGTSTEAEYLEVETTYGYRGFARKGDLERADVKTAAQWEETEDTVLLPAVDVMSAPKYASVVMITLPKGAKVRRLMVTEGDWEKVLLADDREGWVRIGFCRPIEKIGLDQEETLRRGIVSAAMTYMGCQYRWGGKTPLGIDCSGLASMAYMLNGWLIPRDADVQAEKLRSIDRKEAKPGDLLFFPGHVAIYLGGGEYIHATGREGYVLRNSIQKGAVDYREDHDKELYGVGTLFKK